MIPIFTYMYFEIGFNPDCACEYKYYYMHVDYDGPEDNRRGDCRTILDCIDNILEYYEDLNSEPESDNVIINNIFNF